MNLIMKKIFITACILSAFYGTAQVRMTGTGITSSNSSAFIDASSNTTNNGTVGTGKGLVFPRVDLSTFSFVGSTGVASNFPSRFDGMIVYNTALSGVAGAGTTQGTLSPGFWFYENKSNSTTGGTWKALSGTGSDSSVTGTAPISVNLGVVSVNDLGITTIKIANDAVTNAKIANGAITAAKLDQMAATNGQVLKWNGTSWAPAADAGLTTTTVSNVIASGQLTTTVNGTTATAVTLPTAPAASTIATGLIQLAGDLSGTATSPFVANNAITSDKILNGTIATTDLADNSITNIKIANGAITASKLDQMTATNGQVLKWNGTSWAPAADAGLTTTTVSNVIASGQLTTTVNGITATAVTLPAAPSASTTATGLIQLAGDLSGTATSPSVANNAITSDKILNGTIATTDLADNSVATAKITDNAVTIAKLPAGATNTTFLRGDGTWVETASVTNISSSEVAMATKIDGAQLYAIKGTFTATGSSSTVTINKPAGMTGYYSLTTYKDGKTFRNQILSFDTVATTNNVTTGTGFMTEVYPAGTYNYVLEYFK